MTSTNTPTLETLHKNADQIRANGATALYMFGSAAREELREDSDVDLFLDYEPDGSFTFVEWARLEEHLKRILGRDVDLMTRYSLHPRLKEGIERSSIQVF